MPLLLLPAHAQVRAYAGILCGYALSLGLHFGTTSLLLPTYPGRHASHYTPVHTFTSLSAFAVYNLTATTGITPLCPLTASCCINLPGSPFLWPSSGCTAPFSLLAPLAMPILGTCLLPPPLHTPLQNLCFGMVCSCACRRTHYARTGIGCTHGQAQVRQLPYPQTTRRGFAVSPLSVGNRQCLFAAPVNERRLLLRGRSDGSSSGRCAAHLHPLLRPLLRGWRVLL